METIHEQILEFPNWGLKEVKVDEIYNKVEIPGGWKGIDFRLPVMGEYVLGAPAGERVIKCDWSSPRPCIIVEWAYGPSDYPDKMIVDAGVSIKDIYGTNTFHLSSKYKPAAFRPPLKGETFLTVMHLVSQNQMGDYITHPRIILKAVSYSLMDIYETNSPSIPYGWESTGEIRVPRAGDAWLVSCGGTILTTPNCQNSFIKWL